MQFRIDLLWPDPKKTEAVKKMPPPTSLMGLQIFIDILNQLNKTGRCIPATAEPPRPKTGIHLDTSTYYEAFQKVKRRNYFSLSDDAISQMLSPLRTPLDEQEMERDNRN